MISEDEEKQINSHYETAQNLFRDFQIERTTNVQPIEIQVLSILRSFADIQDAYRKKYHNITESCFLTKLLDSNMKLRMSINGWRANQTVDILHSPKLDITNTPNSNTQIIPIRRM